MSKLYDIKIENKDFNTRERLTIVLVLFLINLLKPWKYSHEQEKFMNDIYRLIGIGGGDGKA